MCVYHRSSILYPPLLYVKGGVCAPRVSPVVHIYRSTVRQLLSGSVHAYESPPATCVYQMLWRASRASRLTCTVLSISSLFRILLPRMSNLLVFSAMSLCYAYAYAYPPLCISSTSVDYLSSGTIRRTSLQQDVCWRLILGYNRWYFFPPYITSHSLPLLQCHVHFANFMLNVWWACDFSLFFIHQRACEITSPNSAKSTLVRSSGTPIASRAALLSSHLKTQLRSTRSWSGSISWMGRPSVCCTLQRHPCFLTNVRFVTDRPQTRDSTGGTPAKHAVFCWWLSTADHGRFYACFLFQIWKSCRRHGHGRP